MPKVEPRFKPPKAAPRRRQWNSTLPAGSRRRPQGVSLDVRAEVLARAGGRCQADGLHHPDCPGELGPWDWVVHHVRPRSKGGDDSLDNLIAVWCPGRRGWNGCHGLHNRPDLARSLGLLR